MTVLTPAKGLAWDSVPEGGALSVSRTYLRGHQMEVNDVAWAPDSRRLVSGSVDNTAIVWDLVKKRSIAVLEGHTQWVQGVAWDVTGGFIVTQSTDRTARVYSVESDSTMRVGKKRGRPAAGASAGGELAFSLVQVINARKMEEGAGAGAPPSSARHHMYVDEAALQTFFRRPAFSPDGTLLLTPAGQHRASADAAARPTTWVFQMEAGKHANVIAHLPVAASYGGRSSILTRFSPVLYTLRSPGPSAAAPFTLPYRLMWAVATLDNVYVYDSQHPHPLAVIANMHMDRLTDIAWSASGRTLLLSSYDGYCTLVHLDAGDVGERLPEAAYPPTLRSGLRSQSTFPVPKVGAKRAAKAAGEGSPPEAAAAGGEPLTPGKEWQGVEVGKGGEAAAAPAQPLKRKIALVQLAPPGAQAAPFAAAPFAAVQPVAPAPGGSAEPAPVATVAEGGEAAAFSVLGSLLAGL